MAGQGKAAAGHTGTGGPEGDKAPEGQAAGAAPENAPQAGSAAPAVLPVVAEGLTGTDDLLYAYMGQMTSPRPAGFQPFEALNARLGEFSQPSKEASPVSSSEGEGAADAHAHKPAGPYRGELDWFEQRFGELKQLLSRKGDEEREMAAVNARLAEIVKRIDRLTAAMPSGKTMAAVETNIAALSRSLNETRQQSTADAERISRAAKEILAASSRSQEAPERFETAARQTVEALGQTVAATAARAAMLAASQVSAASNRSSGVSGVERLESELRSLNRQSRESGERTAVALDRVHQTLRDFLERGPASRSGDEPAQPKKRAGVHEPISSDSSVYMRAETGFGAKPSPNPRLDTLTLRQPRPPDPNLLKALEEAEERLASGWNSNPQKNDTQQPSWAAPFFRNSPLGEEERHAPLAGIAIVAFILLLVSGALYYLHTRTRSAEALESSVRPSAEAASKAPARLTSTESTSYAGSAAQSMQVQPGAGNPPSLLPASDQSRILPGTPRPAAEDELKVLESAAREGDREAQFHIGELFLNGAGGEGGAAIAGRWLERAARQGHTEAQFMLASLLERGAGMAKDEGQAIALYRRAASAGHLRAMHNLGVLLSGRGSPQDYLEAASWFSRAAMAGLADSQYNLALLYERGLGLTQDLSQAYIWYSAAAKAGDQEAERQAERIKPMLEASEKATGAAVAGSWRPVLEERPARSGQGSARG